MSGPVDGRLLDHDRVARQPLGERGQHVARGQRLAGTGGAGGSGARRGAAARRAAGRVGERAADGGGWREHSQLGGAAVRLVRVVADDGDPRARAR